MLQQPIRVSALNFSGQALTLPEVADGSGASLQSGFVSPGYDVTTPAVACNRTVGLSGVDRSRSDDMVI